MYIDKATLAATITNVDNGGSDIRITAPSHGLTTGDTVLIAGVTGTTEANGTYTVTVTSSSQFTLDSTTFSNDYVSGGGVYTGWRLRASLGASDYDCVAVISYKKFASGVVSDIVTTAQVISTATNTLIASDPTYAYAIELINILSTEGSGDIALTLQLLNKSNTVYAVATATIAAGYRFTLDGTGVMTLTDATGMNASSGGGA